MSGRELPNPFSREGSRPSDALGSGAADPTAASHPALPGSEPAAPASTTFGAADPTGWSLLPTTGAPTADPYRVPEPAPAPVAPPYPAAVSATPGGYGSNPYDVAPYQPAYGSYSPYGFVPPPHPQAVLAMVLGIVGLAVCPFVGIAGLVIGRRVRNEIDAQPGRYGGRSQATAGFVLGIISVVAAGLWIAYFAVIFGLIGASAGYDNF